MSDALVAVDLGRRAVRVATASGVTTLPAAGDPESSVRAAVGRLRPSRLVLTHPTRWSPARAERLRRAVSDVADRVEMLAAPQAAAGLPSGSVAVLDVGARDAEVTVIAVSAPSCALSGRRPFETAIVACRHEAVGGDDLDEALLDVVGGPWRGLLDSIDPARAPQRRSLRLAARHAREQLATADHVVLRFAETEVSETEVAVTQAELRDASATVLGRAVDLLAAAIGVEQPWPPVLLIGGVAQTPQLAELVAQRGATAVTVATQPGTAAVRGALVSPRPPPASRPLLPPVLPPRRHLLRNGLIAALAAAVLVVAGHVLTPPVPQTAVPPVNGLLVQYDYSLQLPAGWQHTGGLPEHRRSLLTLPDRPGGTDLISVEETVLDYDASAEPRRAAADLRARYDAALASGAALEGFNPAESFAGRQVTTYRQRQPERDAVVDWYVIFDGAAQLSVGCQHTVAGAVAVGAGCETVVASLRLRPR